MNIHIVPGKVKDEGDCETCTTGSETGWVYRIVFNIRNPMPGFINRHFDVRMCIKCLKEFTKTLDQLGIN